MNEQAKKILLADDDLEDQEMFKDTILELEPETEVQSVINGKQVLDHLAQIPESELPCLIILDYNMPELNGPQVLQVLSSLQRYKAIPKLIWSTSNTATYIKDCMDKGAVKYFVKPSNVIELREIVKNMLALCKCPS